MEFSHLSLIGGLAMLIVGVALYGVLRKLLYRRLRWRHEAAKVEGRGGIEPNVIMGTLKFVCLVLVPLLGLVLGDPALKALLSI